MVGFSQFGALSMKRYRHLEYSLLKGPIAKPKAIIEPAILAMNLAEERSRDKAVRIKALILSIFSLGNPKFH